MDCWYPVCVRAVRDRSGKVKAYNYKSGDFEYHSKCLFSSTPGLIRSFYVPCGRCPPCRRRKQNEWAFRIMEEAKVHRHTAFVTLTYSDDNLPLSDSGVPTLFPDHLHKFFKNLRYNFNFRYFACGEYGDKFDRPHYHFILFTNSQLTQDEIQKHIEERWVYGFVQYQCPVTPGRAKYCAKYSMKQVGFDYGDVVPPFARMSRRPGIGKQFLTDDLEKHFREHNIWTVYDQQGTPYPLPRYYRERIYSQDERDRHTDLLTLTKHTKDDYARRLYYQDGNTRRYESSIIEDIDAREYLFIKHLQKENYGFKYKAKHRKTLQELAYERNEKSEWRNILVSDEF